MAAIRIKTFTLRWGPTLLMMGLIFLFSSIPMKPQLPSAGLPKLDWLTLIRKGGHLLGYALLALALQHGLRLKGWQGVAAILCCVLLYALSDEFHQSFVLGRSARLTDVGIDLLGGILGLVVARTLGKVLNDVVTHSKP